MSKEMDSCLITTGKSALTACGGVIGGGSQGRRGRQLRQERELQASRSSFSGLSDGVKKNQRQDRGAGLVLSTPCFTVFQIELIKCVFLTAAVTAAERWFSSQYMLGGPGCGVRRGLSGAQRALPSGISDL